MWYVSKTSKLSQRKNTRHSSSLSFEKYNSLGVVVFGAFLDDPFLKEQSDSTYYQDIPTQFHLILVSRLEMKLVCVSKQWFIVVFNPLRILPLIKVRSTRIFSRPRRIILTTRKQRRTHSKHSLAEPRAKISSKRDSSGQKLTLLSLLCCLWRILSKRKQEKFNINAVIGLLERLIVRCSCSER